MSNIYRVSYKVEGVRITDIYLPEGLETPKDFPLWDYPEQDEWLYENQIGISKVLEDIHHAQADSILKVRHLKAI